MMNNIVCVNSQLAKAKQDRNPKKTTGAPSLGFCTRLKDCMVVSSAISHYPQTTAMRQLQKQLAEIEAELQKQREARTLYKTKLETIQGYLKNCLQLAQDHGFLHIITAGHHSDIKQPETEIEAILPSNPTNGSTITIPQKCKPVESYPDSCLAGLIDEAKIFGWYIEPQEIELQEVVAKGTTAIVHRGRWRGFDVAVKCIFPNLFESNEHMIGFFTQEVEVLSRQRHPFVLQLMGACLDPPNHGWIVTEFLSTTIKTWLHGPGSRRKERTVPIPPLQQRLEKALEISQAMQYLHEQKPAKVIHRDLKPSNIFLDHDMHVRVADFGHARFLADGQKALTGETGTFVYMAPEIIRCGPYDEKSDVYSFGIILNELITGEHPYIQTDYGPSKIAIEVASNGLRPTLTMEDEGLQDLTELVQHSWEEDAARRPSFATITYILRSVLERLINTQ